MKDLPESNGALVVKADHADGAARVRVCSEIEAPAGEFRAGVSFVGDPDLAALSIGALTSLAQRGPCRSVMFIVDRIALTNPEHPILVLDRAEEPGRTFCGIPREMWSVEDNLSLAGMDFEEFAGGVFRGFPEPELNPSSSTHSDSANSRCACPRRGRPSPAGPGLSTRSSAMRCGYGGRMVAV